MILVVFGGWVLKRPSDLHNSLFAAAIIILVWEPRQLFQAGFQLSFFVVLCIILILPFFDQLGNMPIGEAVIKALADGKPLHKSKLILKVQILVGQVVNESSFGA